MAAWLLRIDGADVAWLLEQLSIDERAAAARIRSPRRRAEYAASRVFAKFVYADEKRHRDAPGRWRLVDSGSLRRSSGSVEMFDYAVIGSAAGSGPPRLYDVNSRRYACDLSLSHKWPFVAVGYGHGQACGVDVERVGSISAGVEAYYLREANDLATALPLLAQEERLTLLWTLKEAAFKAFRLESGCCGLQDVRITELRVETMAPDGTTLGGTLTVHLRQHVRLARARFARFGRLFCAEVNL